MLHKLKSTYREIAKYFPELNKKLSSSEHKKQVLLKMARKGEPRPDFKNPLGNSLSSYTIKSSSIYDPKFDREIRNIRPEWFKVEHKKRLLLEMARKGEQKPNAKTSIGIALRAYTRKSSNCYDPKFHGEIKKLAPEWLVSLVERANQKRRLLLEMARKGKPKPTIKTLLGRVLGHYTRKHSNCYHAKFDREIRKSRPDWFISHSERADEKKQDLLEMARKGEPRPDRNNSLGVSLSIYTIKSSSSYDAKFSGDIRKMRPDWFVSKSEKAKQKKRLLIKMARCGEERPRQTTPLGKALGLYTCRKCDSYDASFDKNIRKIRPEWFISQIERSNQNKQLLLEMARKGKPKPTIKTLLGRVLRGYTKKSSKRYDRKFDRDVRKISHDWFAVRSEEKKKQLLGIAKNGRPKPQFNSLLGKALYSYTRKSCDVYDPAFDRQIKKLAADWFVPKSEKKKKILLEMARKGEPKPKRKTPTYSAMSSYTIKSSNYYDPRFAKQIRKLAPHWFKK